jgi:hypothetical protein
VEFEERFIVRDAIQFISHGLRFVINRMPLPAVPESV